MLNRIRPALFLSLILMLLAAAPAAAKDDAAAFRASVRQLMRLTGAGAIGEQTANAVFQAVASSMRKADPNISPRAIAIAQEVAAEEFGALFSNEERLLDLYVPIYRRHYTKAEIDQLIAFYQTPIGKKSIRVMPAIFQESMQAGQQWSASIMPRFAQKLQQRLSAEGLIQMPANQAR